VTILGGTSPVVSRRRVLSSVAAVIAAPLTATAQPTERVYRIGFLGGSSPTGYASLVDALRLGLREHGYVERKNIAIEYRWAEGQYERLPALAAELVRLPADVIITQGTPAAFAAKRATTKIPIVMAIVGDPVASGVVASLAHSGSNVTGSSFFMADLNAKRLELMKELLPNLQRAGVLMNPGNAAMVAVFRAMEERAHALRLRLRAVNVRRLDELDGAFALAKRQVETVTIADEGLFIANARRIADLAIQNRLPSIGFREFCENGGLLAYGVDFPHIWRQSAALVDKILKGAKPSSLPIQQATRFELIVNLRTARAFGLSIPTSIHLRANRTIE
jgi:ABC-type uncharacterized transport system substrate-binding protein